MSKINILGKRFGRLTVIADAGIDHRREAKWRCRCDCGNEHETTGSNLRNGTTRSCGCFRSEQQMLRPAKPKRFRSRAVFKRAYDGGSIEDLEDLLR
jgi:hypothetical protein